MPEKKPAVFFAAALRVHSPARRRGQRLVVATLLVFCSVLFAPRTARAISNGVAPKASDTRYDAVAAFSFAHWLGLDPQTGAVDATCGGKAGCQQNNWFCNATLLSPTVIVTAKHCVTLATPSAVRFRRHLNGTLGTLEAGPSSYHHVLVKEWHAVPGNLDMYFATLAKPVTHIVPIGPLVLGVDALGIGTPVQHAGWGKQGPLFNEGPLTELRLCATSLTATPKTYWTTKTPGAEPPGCAVNTHDSGSPLLLEGPGGALRTLGVTTSVGAGNSFVGLPGPPTLPLTHSPFDGQDLALRMTMPDQLLAPNGMLEVSLSAEDVGALPTLTNVAINLAFEGPGGVTLPLGSVEVTPTTSLALTEFQVPLPASAAGAFGSYRLHASVAPNQSFSEAISANNDARSTTFASVTANPADAESIWAAFTSGGVPAGAVTHIVTRKSGAIDIAAASASINLLETRINTPIDVGLSVTLKSPLGVLVVSKNANDGGYSVALTAQSLVTTSAADALSRFGPAGHLAGLYTGLSKAALPLAALVAGDGSLRLQVRQKGVPTGQYAILDAMGVFAFYNDASIGKATWNEAKNTVELELVGSASVPDGKLWLVAPKNDLDEDGAPADADCQPENPAIFPGAAEVCNGIDDDCDGIDDSAAPIATTCGIGACTASGARTCAKGVETDSCVPGSALPGDGTCDGIDDDCDGLTDEDGACLAPNTKNANESATEASCAIGSWRHETRTTSLLPLGAAMLFWLRRRRCEAESAKRPTSRVH